MNFRLKELRTARKISQLKLAIDLNMNQNSISRYEKLEREADYETLIKFADYFNVSLDYLLGRRIAEDSSLSDFEQRLLNAARKADERARQDALSVLMAHSVNLEQD